MSDTPVKACIARVSKNGGATGFSGNSRRRMQCYLIGWQDICAMCHKYYRLELRCIWWDAVMYARTFGFKLQISSLERVATISFDLVSVPGIRFAVFILYLQFPFPQQQRTTFPPNANLDALSDQGMQRRLIHFFNALWRNCKKSASSRRMVFVP